MASHNKSRIGRSFSIQVARPIPLVQRSKDIARATSHTASENKINYKRKAQQTKRKTYRVRATYKQQTSAPNNTPRFGRGTVLQRAGKLWPSLTACGSHGRRDIRETSQVRPCSPRLQGLLQIIDLSLVAGLVLSVGLLSRDDKLSLTTKSSSSTPKCSTVNSVMLKRERRTDRTPTQQHVRHI